MDRNKVKNTRWIRRKKHVRKKVFGTPARPRLTVTRSLLNIHCQVIDDTSGQTLAAASTQSKEIRDDIAGKGGNRAAATKVGELLAKKAKEKGIDAVVFDRNGLKYHGRIAALADAVRKEGIRV